MAESLFQNHISKECQCYALCIYILKLPDGFWKHFSFLMEYATKSETICFWKQVHIYFMILCVKTKSTMAWTTEALWTTAVLVWAFSCWSLPMESGKINCFICLLKSAYRIVNYKKMFFSRGFCPYSCKVSFVEAYIKTFLEKKMVNQSMLTLKFHLRNYIIEISFVIMV